MGTAPFITYGLDIEIDTTNGSVDPDRVPVRSIGISTSRGDHLFTGSEVDMLRSLDEVLRRLPPGVIATWNGAIFDLPFLAHRAGLLGTPLDLVLVPDATLTRGRRPLPGRSGAHRAAWGRHRHLDTFLVYGDSSPRRPWSNLFGLGRRRGLIANTRDLLNEALHAHALSDARLARALAERRVGAALRLVDHLDDTELGTVRDRRPRSAADRPRLRPAVAGL